VNTSRVAETFDVRRLTAGRGAHIAHGCALLAGFVFLLWMNRNQWYYYDEWDFLANRGLAGDGRSVWAPHNEHWTTIPILLYLAIGWLVGLGHPLAFALPMIVAHLVVAHLLWRICLRAGVRTWTATAVTTTFVFLGAGAENLLWAFQVCFVGSVAFGLGALLVVDRPGTDRWAGLPWGWTLATCSLMCSGIGLPMVALITVVLLARRDIARAVLFAAVPAVAQGLWYLTYGRHARSHSGVTARTWVYLDEFATRGLGYALETWLGIAGIGGILIPLLLVVGVSHVARGGTGLTPGILCLGVFPLFATFAVSRIGIGIDTGIAGRYAYVVVALALPAVAIALDRACAAPRMLSAVLAICAMSTWIGMTTLVQQARAGIEFERPGRVTVTSAQVLLDRHERILAQALEPVHLYGTPTLRQLIALNERGRRVNANWLSDQDLLTSRFFLQTQLGAAVPGIPVMTVAPQGTTPRTSRSADCATFASGRLTGSPNGAGAVELVVAKPTSIVVELRDRSGRVARKSYPLTAGRQYLTMTARDVDVTIVLLAQPVQVCGDDGSDVGGR
jgi:hypothetical protein